MRILRCSLVIVAIASGMSLISAAQSFPGRPGHWEATVTSSGQEPMTFKFCLNDQTWGRALNTSKTCTLSNFSSGLMGATYHVSCTIGKTGKMEGDSKLVFEGKEHMTGGGKFHGEFNGKPLDSESKADYRWTSSTCDGNEINLRAEKMREQQH